MARFIFVVSLLIGLAASSLAQEPSPISGTEPPTTSDPQALTLATKSLLLLTRGVIVTDATINATIIRLTVPESENGTAIFYAKGIDASRVDMTANNETQTEVRSNLTGIPTGKSKKGDSKALSSAQHNCLTDTAWFFPALSALTQVANPNFVFKFIGQEQHGEILTNHIRVFQTSTPKIQRLSTVDFYLDSVSALPVAIAWDSHADNDVNVDIPNEVRFALYKPVNGIQVPFHFQQLSNGSLTLDVSVTDAAINTGLSDTLFSLE